MNPVAPSFYLMPDQVRDSGLLSPERMAEVEAEIERRISIPQDPQGRPIENARLADLSPWPRYLYPRMDHEYNWEYMRRSIMAVVLTEEERQMLDKHALGAASAKRDRDRFAKAKKVEAKDWEGGVCDGDEYFDSVEDYCEHWREFVRDEEAGFNDPPKYVWATTPTQIITGRDVASIFECQMEDRGWDEMDVDDLNGVPELEAALDHFVEVNKGVTSQHIDYTTAVLIGPELTEELADIHQR